MKKQVKSQFYINLVPRQQTPKYKDATTVASSRDKFIFPKDRNQRKQGGVY